MKDEKNSKIGFNGVEKILKCIDSSTTKTHLANIEQWVLKLFSNGYINHFDKNYMITYINRQEIWVT